MWTTAQLIVTAVLLMAVLFEAFRAIRAAIQSKRDLSNPRLFLRAMRFAIYLTAGFSLELALTYRADLFKTTYGFVAVFCGICALLLTAVYFMVRRQEGTGDRPKDPPR